MREVPLGSSGLRVSAVGLGTMTLGAQVDEEASGRILDRAQDLGITFLDTADTYPYRGPDDPDGRTEEILGRWVRAAPGRRDDVVIATKFGASADPATGGGRREQVLAAADASLRRLGVDHIDLYQMHRDDPDVPIEESLDALCRLVEAGKVRSVGWSNVPAYRLALALGRSALRELPSFVSVQVRYNLVFRGPEREMFPLCREEGVAVLPYNPLAGGLLTGKHDAERPAGRFALPVLGGRYRDRYWHEHAFRLVGRLSELARAHDRTLVQAALGWVNAHPAVTAPIVGVTTLDQLDACVAALRDPLPPELYAQLQDATRLYRMGDAPW